MYQNIPHEEVDWAALAQQWIQMRENMTGANEPPMHPPLGTNPPVPNLPVPPQHISLPPPRPSLPGNEMGNSRIRSEPENPPSGRPLTESKEVLSHSDNSNSQDGSTYSQGGDWGYWQSNWNATNSSNWVPPPSETKEGIQTFEYGHMHGNQGYAAQTYDYNHGSDQLTFNQSVPGQPPFNQYWTQDGPPPFLRRDKKEDAFDRGQSPTPEEETTTPTIDAAKRKNLPAWIREGLEKMEREKQKKIERERMLREREQRLKMQQEEEERAMRELQDMEAAPALPRKSKFDSDSEVEDSPQFKAGSPSSRNYQDASPMHPRTPSPIDVPKTEQEKFEILMLKVRQWLTEILLEVTNEEIHSIAKDTFSRAQTKAPALQLAKSSALASITGSLGGLGGYGSDSDLSESENSSEDSDAALQENIRKRKLEFARKARELRAGSHTDASEEEKEVHQDRSRLEDKDKKEPRGQANRAFLSPSGDEGREKYHFEKKYVEIPGLEMNPDYEGTEKNSDSVENMSSSRGDAAEAVKNDSIDSDQSSSSSSSTSSSSSSGNGKSRSETSSKNEKGSSRDTSGSPNEAREAKRSKEQQGVRVTRSSSRERGGKEKSPSESRGIGRSREGDAYRRRSSSRERGSKDGRSRRESTRNSSYSHDRSRHRSGSRDKGKRGGRRSYSRSSSRSRSHSRERSKGYKQWESYGARDSRRRRYSRSRSRSYNGGRRSRSRSVSSRRRRYYSRSRSRSPSARSRPSQRYKSRYSRSPSRDSYDRRTGKKSSRKPRV